MKETNSNRKKATPSGAATTLTMLIFVFIAAALWLEHMPGEDKATPSLMKKNELRALENLKTIADGQEKYRAHCHEINGKTEYAAFVTHLWVSVEPSGAPVKLDLIAEKLAVAIGPTKALDGYYYVDVRQRYELPGKNMRSVDYRTQWAVAAIPRQAGRTGGRVFLADQSGRIFAKPVNEFTSLYPLEPEEDGWALASKSGG